MKRLTNDLCVEKDNGMKLFEGEVIDMTTSEFEWFDTMPKL